MYYGVRSLGLSKVRVTLHRYFLISKKSYIYKVERKVLVNLAIALKPPSLCYPTRRALLYDHALYCRLPVKYSNSTFTF